MAGNTLLSNIDREQLCLPRSDSHIPMHADCTVQGTESWQLFWKFYINSCFFVTFLICHVFYAVLCIANLDVCFSRFCLGYLDNKVKCRFHLVMCNYIWTDQSWWSGTFFLPRLLWTWGCRKSVARSRSVQVVFRRLSGLCTLLSALLALLLCCQ